MKSENKSWEKNIKTGQMSKIMDNCKIK